MNKNIKTNTNFNSSFGVVSFLLKGLLRDKSRSLLPIIVVSLGVMFTVFLQYIPYHRKGQMWARNRFSLR